MKRKTMLVAALGTAAVMLLSLAVQSLIRRHLKEQEKHERVALLRASVKEWNSWRTRNPNVDVDLSNVNLRGVDLDGADLSAVDLRGADLASACLDSANLSRANLNGANLNRTDLERADLTDADMTRSDLSGAALYDATLRRTILREANLSRLTRMSIHLQVFEDVELTRATSVPAGWLERVKEKRTTGSEELSGGQ